MKKKIQNHGLSQKGGRVPPGFLREKLIEKLRGKITVIQKSNKYKNDKIIGTIIASVNFVYCKIRLFIVIPLIM